MLDTLTANLWFALSWTFKTLIVYTIARTVQRYIEWVYSPLRQNVPGPNEQYGFFFGAFFTIRKEPFMVPHRRWIEQSSDGWNMPMLQYSSFFGKTQVVLLERQLVKQVLTAPYGKLPLKYGKDVNFLKNILGEGLVTAEGEHWMRHRQIIQPAFYTTALKESLNVGVPPLTLRLVEIWKQAEGREIDIASHLSCLTLDIIGQLAFSYDFNALDSIERWVSKNNEPSSTPVPVPNEVETSSETTTTTTRDDSNEEKKDDNNKNIDKNGNSATPILPPTGEELIKIEDPLLEAMMKTFRPSIIGTLAFMLNLPWLSRHFNPRTKNARVALDIAVDEVVAKAKKSIEDETREEKENTTKTSKNTKRSLLQLLLQANETEEEQDGMSTKSKKRTLTHEELRDECKTFIFAGHETTSTWCNFVVYCLVAYPDIQEKVYEDVIRHAPGTTQLTIELVDQMEYLHAFLQEVLRFHPPVGMFGRVIKDPNGEKFDKTVIPAGTRVVVPIYLMHRHPKYWKDPDSFLPERWLEAKKQQQTTTETGDETSKAGKEEDEKYKTTKNPQERADEEEEDFWTKIRFAFLPFSAGGRNCIGQRFAQVEAKLIMAELIRNFIFSKAPSQKDADFAFSNMVVRKIRPRLQIVVKSRS